VTFIEYLIYLFLFFSSGVRSVSILLKILEAEKTKRSQSSSHLFETIEQMLSVLEGCSSLGAPDLFPHMSSNNDDDDKDAENIPSLSSLRAKFEVMSASEPQRLFDPECREIKEFSDSVRRVKMGITSSLESLWRSLRVAVPIRQSFWNEAKSKGPAGTQPIHSAIGGNREEIVREMIQHFEMEVRMILFVKDEAERLARELVHTQKLVSRLDKVINLNSMHGNSFNKKKYTIRNLLEILFENFFFCCLIG
jgi:hypothetical protein